MNLLKRLYAHVYQLVNPPAPQGEEGIRRMGHREYVGGMWDEIGKLQFEFLKGQGLQPENVLLDIGCGSLRAGRWLIPYLSKGHYLGLDKEEELLTLGKASEVEPQVLAAKKPQFMVSRDFDFSGFDQRPDFVLAQSLFTHLQEAAIHLCLRNLRDIIRPSGQFFATFFLSEAPFSNPKVSHDHLSFKYSTAQVVAFGEANGWDTEVIGDWGHPRGQSMVRYTLKTRGE